MTSRDAAASLLDLVKDDTPAVVKLATLVSLSVRIEPELLRAIRLVAAPQLHAAVEADLWFSALVASRGPDGIAFSPQVTQLLRERLRDQVKREIVERIWRKTQRLHRDLSPALALEERVAWYALIKGSASTEAIERELSRALVTLVDQRHAGVARWAAQAWPRLPPEARATKTAWQLKEASRPHLGAYRIRAEDETPEQLGEVDLRTIVKDLPDVRLAVRRVDRIVELGRIESEGAIAILLPDTDPRLVELRWTDTEGGPRLELVQLRQGGTERVLVGTGQVQLRTARGVLYELAALEPALFRPTRTEDPIRPDDSSASRGREGFDPARVVEVYVQNPAGDQRVGSGYFVGDQVLITAGHLIAGLPVNEAATARPVQCEVRPLGLADWLPARVVWHDPAPDVALVRLAADWRVPDGSPAPAWGRLDGDEQVGCMAVGFPWAQARPDQVRDTEQLLGQIAPLTTAKTGKLAVNVVTAPPASSPNGGSPWAGMSGAALFAGPYLVGVIVVDPRRYGTDRLQATPISLLTDDPGWWQAVGGAKELVGVGRRFRLTITQDLSLVLEPPYRPLPAGLEFAAAPVRLLLPEHGVVPFLGRQQLLDDLQAWCTPTPSSLGVQVLTGSGGSGKTRLAAELCVRMLGLGWDAGFADPSGTNGQTQLGVERPTLLVVDDADLKVQLSTEILTRLAAQPHRPPIRLLLLARYQGTWWEQFTTQTDGLAEDYTAPQLSLETGALILEERERHRETATAVFAAQLPGEHPTVKVPVLTDPVFANPLLIHMSVLLALLGQPATTVSGGSPRTRVLQRLLDREHKRWTNSLPGAGLADLSDTVATQAVTVATLTYPETRTDMVRLLQAVPELADADLERRGRIADWLHQLYPGGTGYVAPLQPDLLAEQHLADTPDLPQLTVNAYQHTTFPAQVAQLLAELTRAARTHPAAQAALSQLLDARLPDLLDHALTAPTSPIPGLLTQALQTAPHPEATTQLVNRLPQRSTALATLAATLSGQAVQHHRTLAEANPDAYLPDLAGALNNLGARLADVGQREQALALTQEAVTTYRRLAEANPDAYLPDLAGALNNLGARLADVGQREQALALTQEAVTTYRRLAEANPDAYLPDLAGALNNLGARLADVGQREQALALTQEAVTTYRRLAEANPDAYLPDLAGALNNLGARLADVGQREQALALTQEAVTTYRRLAEANPDAYLPDLAGALNNLGARLADVGQREQALALTQEAVTTYRRLAEANPDAYLPDLAGALNNLGARLADVGQREQARQIQEELGGLTTP